MDGWRIILVDADGKPIDLDYAAEVNGVLTKNALMISASPELLAVAEELLRTHGHYEDFEAVDLAYAAIAKARGETRERLT